MMHRHIPSMICLLKTDQVHGFKLPGDYLESVKINLEGFTVSSGSNPYNVQDSDINGVSSPKDFFTTNTDRLRFSTYRCKSRRTY